MSSSYDMISRRQFLRRGAVAGAVLFSPIAPAILAGGCGRNRDTESAAETLRRAVSYLWSRQSPDGSWRSENYAVLRSGQAYTPVVLFALLNVPTEVVDADRDAVRAAIERIRSLASPAGCLGVADPDVLEYPNYATAYALRCLVRAGGTEDRRLMDLMTRYLVAQQFDERRGIPADSPAYGSWGFGAPALPVGSPGHVDLSHTRFVLEALREAGHGTAATYARALRFLSMTQKHPSESRPQPKDRSDDQSAGPPRYDGGFYFSPVVLGANKGLTEQGDENHGSAFRSYATATCDGLAALLAAGIDRNDERVTAAAAWLRRHPALHRPEGIPEVDPEPWHLALHYYHLAGRATVYNKLGSEAEEKRRIAAMLAAEQLEDGRFENRHSMLMKEDDPLLATTLAVIALNNVAAGLAV